MKRLFADVRFKRFLVSMALSAVLLAPSLLWGGESSGEDVELARFGVSFRPPQNWFSMESAKAVENIRRLDAEKEDIAALLASHRGSIPIGDYLKYNPKGRSGVIPTIKILGRANPGNSFENLRRMMDGSAASVGSVLRNFEIKTKPTERVLSGRRAIFFVAEYDLALKEGEGERVTTTTYAVPCGAFFLQISMNEAVPPQHAQVFEKFLDSFRFKEE